MQGTKLDNKVFLRQNDDHLPVSTAVETNMSYCNIIHYLNLVFFFTYPSRSLNGLWLEESIHIRIPRLHTCLSQMPVVVKTKLIMYEFKTIT